MRRSLFSLLALSACMADEDAARSVLAKDGYTVLTLGPPTRADFRYSFKATKAGQICEGNISVSGLAWLPDYTIAAGCTDKSAAQADASKTE